MAGVLNAASAATYTDSAGTAWTYFLDNDGSGIFYITPVPTFAQSSGSAPQFHLTEYVDGTGNFVSAQCQLGTALTVPGPVILAVQALLQQQGVASPTFQAMPFIDVPTGGVDPNQALLSYANVGGTVSGSVQTMPSLSGNQTAIFNLTNLTATDLAFFKAYFGGATDVGTVAVSYRLTAWARLGAITALVHFDAQAAYTYQRTFKWVR